MTVLLSLLARALNELINEDGFTLTLSSVATDTFGRMVLYFKVKDDVIHQQS